MSRNFGGEQNIVKSSFLMIWSQSLVGWLEFLGQSCKLDISITIFRVFCNLFFLLDLKIKQFFNFVALHEISKSPYTIKDQRLRSSQVKTTLKINQSFEMNVFTKSRDEVQLSQGFLVELKEWWSDNNWFLKVSIWL